MPQVLGISPLLLELEASYHSEGKSTVECCQSSDIGGGSDPDEVASCCPTFSIASSRGVNDYFTDTLVEALPPKQPGSKPQVRFDGAQKAVIDAWVALRQTHPYLSQGERSRLAVGTGLSEKQIANDVNNFRRRHLRRDVGRKPLADSTLGESSPRSYLNDTTSFASPLTESLMVTSAEEAGSWDDGGLDLSMASLEVRAASPALSRSEEESSQGQLFPRFPDVAVTLPDGAGHVAGFDRFDGSLLEFYLETLEVSASKGAPFIDQICPAAPRDAKVEDNMGMDGIEAQATTSVKTMAIPASHFDHTHVNIDAVCSRSTFSQEPPNCQTWDTDIRLRRNVEPRQSI